MPEKDQIPYSIGQRFNELESRMKLHLAQVSQGLVDLEGQGNDEFSEKIESTIRQSARLGSTISDLSWAHALLDIVADPVIIAKIWDTKDEYDRQLKEDSDLKG